MTFIAPIVEGQGEVEALPILLRRISQHANATSRLQVNQPIRVKSGSFINKEEYFSKYVGMAATKAAQSRGTVLILLDCDDECPAVIGPALLARASAIRGDVSYLVVLAHREFESWFIASVASLAGQFGLPMALDVPADIEGIRDAKGWLGKRMSVSYDPVTHQHQFARICDLGEAQRSPSFKRLYCKIRDLVAN